IPAFAMQGDREKLKKAGMDDYLAKPVRGKSLEKMLVHWATSKRSPHTPDDSDYGGSDCSELEKHDCSSAGTATGLQQDSQSSRPTMSERKDSHRMMILGAESEGD